MYEKLKAIIQRKINLLDTFNKVSEMLYKYKHISCALFGFSPLYNAIGEQDLQLMIRFYLSPKVTAEGTLLLVQDDFSPEHIRLDEIANIPDDTEYKTKINLRIAFIIYTAYRKLINQDNNYRSPVIDRLLEYQVKYDWL